MMATWTVARYRMASLSHRGAVLLEAGDGRFDAGAVEVAVGNECGWSVASGPGIRYLVRSIGSRTTFVILTLYCLHEEPSCSVCPFVELRGFELVAVDGETISDWSESQVGEFLRD